MDWYARLPDRRRHRRRVFRCPRRSGDGHRGHRGGGDVSTDIATLEDINALRRDLLAFRKVAWPCREAVGVLARGSPDQIDEETKKYYRDVYDHLVQVVDLTETYRDLTNGARDITSTRSHSPPTR